MNPSNSNFTPLFQIPLAELSDMTVISAGAKSRASMKGAVLILTAMGVVSCGGGGSPDPVDETPDPLVAQTSTADLKSAAARGFGASINSNFAGAGSVGQDGVDTLLASPLDGLLNGTENSSDIETQQDTVDASTRSLINATLALNDDSGQRTTRNGNRISIQPDANELCAEDALAMDGDQLESERCAMLVENMTVHLDATSETDGTITYLFMDQTLATIGYADNADSLEVFFGGFKAMANADAALNPDSQGETVIPDVFEGAIRMAASSTNSNEGEEAGSVSLSISQALNIVDSNGGGNISVGTGKLFSMSVDAATGEGSINIEVGAVQGTQVDESGATNSIDMKGLTANISGSSDQGTLTVTNLGIGKGPLIVAIDTEKALDLSLDTFGFSVSDSNGEITIDGNLNLSAFVNDAVGTDVLDVSALGYLLQLTAPSGSVMSGSNSGALLVSAGGPLGYSLTGTNSDGRNVSDSVTVNAGQCIGEVMQGDDDVVSLVACD